MDIGEIKLEILKQELTLLQDKANHFDNLRHQTRQMAITLWLAAIGFGLTTNIKEVFFLAVLIPIPFWYFEGMYHKHQEGYVNRYGAIERFLREGSYKVKNQKEVTLADFLKKFDADGFPLLDHYSKNTIPTKDFERNTSLFRNLFKKSKLIFYFSFMLISLLFALFLK